MARTYRFFLRHLLMESLPQQQDRPFHLTEGLEPEIVYQLTKVLRASPGDRITLLPAVQPAPYFEFEYIVESAQKKDVVLRFSMKKPNVNELDFNLGLILCLPNKPDKLELILQKAVELGVNDITLVEGDFSRMKHALRVDRLEKIIIEAAEQSERAKTPSLLVSGKLGKYMESLGEEQRKNIFVAMERMSVDKGNGQAGLQKHISDGEDLQILVGPEGGFSDVEKDMVGNFGLSCLSLGKRILRMETAAILSLGLAALCR